LPIVNAVRRPIVVVEIEFRKVALRAVQVDALHAALEDAEESFNRIRVALADAVADSAMLRGELRQLRYWPASAPAAVGWVRCSIPRIG